MSVLSVSVSVSTEHVNEDFIKPIKLEFEKVYYPYLLMNKKRYAALLWTNPDKFDYMDCKGAWAAFHGLQNCSLLSSLFLSSASLVKVWGGGSLEANAGWGVQGLRQCDVITVSW